MTHGTNAFQKRSNGTISHLLRTGKTIPRGHPKEGMGHGQDRNRSPKLQQLNRSPQETGFALGYVPPVQSRVASNVKGYL